MAHAGVPKIPVGWDGAAGDRPKPAEICPIYPTFSRPGRSVLEILS